MQFESQTASSEFQCLLYFSMAPRMAPKTQAVAKAKAAAKSKMSASGDRDEGKSKFKMSASLQELASLSNSAVKPRGSVVQALAAQVVKICPLRPSPKQKYVDKLRAAAKSAVSDQLRTLVASGTVKGQLRTLVASGTVNLVTAKSTDYQKRKAQTQRLKIFMKLPENKGKALYGIMKVKDMKLEHLREIQDWKMYPHPHLQAHSFRRNVGSPSPWGAGGHWRHDHQGPQQGKAAGHWRQETRSASYR